MEHVQLHAQHAHGAEHEGHEQQHYAAAALGSSLNRIAFTATLHCLTGCAIGEILGMVIGTALGMSNTATIALAIALAFASGYLLTMVPLLRAGLPMMRASRLALASDTASIAIMEVADNAVMVIVPGAMSAPLDSGLFWGSLLVSLVIAGAAAYPVNRLLIARGRGHAVAHAMHGQN